MARSAHKLGRRRSSSHATRASCASLSPPLSVARLRRSSSVWHSRHCSPLPPFPPRVSRGRGIDGRALDEANDALNRATVEGEGERKKGEKAAKDAGRKGKELEAVRGKAKKAKEDFSGMEEKAFEVRRFCKVG